MSGSEYEPGEMMPSDEPIAEGSGPRDLSEQEISRAAGAGAAVRSNLFLFALVAAGVATLYGLSLYKGPHFASAEQTKVEAQVDTAITKLNSQPLSTSLAMYGGQVNSMLQGFYDSAAKTQVPADKLKKNPFSFTRPKALAVEAAEIKPNDAKTAAKAPEAVTQEKAMADLKTLKLQSIMMSPRGGGTVIISNNLLTVGQQIKGFTVKEITARNVVLSWQEKEFVLEMQ